MDKSITIAVHAANLVHELRSELSRPERSGELVWRFRTAYQPQLAALWRSASLIPAIAQEPFLPASVQVICVEGLDADARQVYTMTGLTEENAPALVREVIDKLRWLAQCSLAFRG